MTDSEAYDYGEEVARDKEDERIREARWAEFAIELGKMDRDLDTLMFAVMQSYRSHRMGWELTSREQLIINFAETEGWDGVLVAIARAYREEQDAQKKG